MAFFSAMFLHRRSWKPFWFDLIVHETCRDCVLSQSVLNKKVREYVLIWLCIKRVENTFDLCVHEKGTRVMFDLIVHE